MTPVPSSAAPPAPPYERYAAALSRLPAADRSAPLGLLDLDAFRANAAALHARAGGVPIRVASKSLRIRRAVAEALAQPGFAGVMAFTLPEALWWAESGQADVLLAYPTADVAALGRWVADPAARAAVVVTVDGPEHLELVAAAARAAGVRLDAPGLPPLRICLDVDAAWAAGAYPRFADFRAQRDAVDPARVFTNEHLDRVLGA